MDKTVQITDTICLARAVDTIKYKDSLRIILLATKDARIHDLEGIYMVAVYHAA